jgi:HK97 family phage portal protein
MALLDRVAFWRKSATSTDGYGVFVDLLMRSLSSKAGVTVTRDRALQVSVFFACCRVLMDGVAQVPFKVMQQTPSDVSRFPQCLDAPQHDTYDLLQTQPNGWQSAFEFREQMMLHVLVGRRGAFAFKNIVQIGGRSRIAELILLDPGRVTPKQARDWSLTYEVRGRDGDVQTFAQDQIWHLRGPSWNGFEALDILGLAREALGLTIAAEETQSKMHKNGVRPSGVFSVEGTLNEPQQKQLTNWIKEQAAAENVGNPLIIDRGAKLVGNIMSAVDQQLLETRRHQIEEVCRFMRVMPIMVGYSDKTATFASAEAMFLAHVVHTLMPWYRRIQQSADINLLTKDDRRSGYYTKLDEAGLMRGDMKATAEYLSRLTLAGIIERNYARSKLDLNPIEGLDEPLTPTNMTNDPSGAPAKQEETQP